MSRPPRPGWPGRLRLARLRTDWARRAAEQIGPRRPAGWPGHSRSRHPSRHPWTAGAAPHSGTARGTGSRWLSQCHARGCPRSRSRRGCYRAACCSPGRRRRAACSGRDCSGRACRCGMEHHCAPGRLRASAVPRSRPAQGCPRTAGGPTRAGAVRHLASAAGPLPGGPTRAARQLPARHPRASGAPGHCSRKHRPRKHRPRKHEPPAHRPALRQPEPGLWQRRLLPHGPSPMVSAAGRSRPGPAGPVVAPRARFRRRRR